MNEERTKNLLALMAEVTELRTQVAGQCARIDDLKGKLNRSAHRTAAVLKLTQAARDKGLITVLIEDVENALL